MKKFTINNETFLASINGDMFHHIENSPKYGKLYETVESSHVMEAINTIRKYCPTVCPFALESAEDGVEQYEAEITTEESKRKYIISATVFHHTSHREKDDKGWTVDIVLEAVAGEPDCLDDPYTWVQNKPAWEANEDDVKELLAEFGTVFEHPNFYTLPVDEKDSLLAEGKAKVEASFKAVNALSPSYSTAFNIDID